jgi:FHS family glucose/mannose:H+ symporter-like MFS transporter
MDQKGRRRILWGSFYSYIVTGMAVLLPGAIMPYLLEEFNLGYDQGGLLLALKAIGNLAASILGGVVSDRIGRKPVLAFGALCFAISFAGKAITSSSTLLFILFFIAGVGWGIMNSLVNALVSDTVEGKGSIMNLLHMFFAVGALIAPLIVGFLIKLDLSWSYAEIILSMLSFILFFVFLFMPLQSGQRNKGDVNSAQNPFYNVRYYIFAGLLFMYVGTESSINGWLTTYLSDVVVLKKVSPQDVLSIFWVATIAGRLLSAHLSNFFSKEILLLIYSLGGAIFFALFVLSSLELFVVLCVVMMGLFFAGVYPTTVANASSLIKGSGTAAGIMLSLGGLGGAVVPYLNGLIAEHKGLYASMSVIIFFGLILIGIAITNIFIAKKEKAF